MKRALFLSLALWLAAAGNLNAHEIIQNVTRGNAVVITLSEPDGSPFSYESFEVYREGEETPYQTGRTDALGRIVFLPDRQGAWRVRAFSEDGHGIDTRLQAGPADGPDGASKSPEAWGPDRYPGVTLGIFVILVAFAVALAILRRRGR
jgi:nickel transport protein